MIAIVVYIYYINRLLVCKIVVHMIDINLTCLNPFCSNGVVWGIRSRPSYSFYFLSRFVHCLFQSVPMFPLLCTVHFQMNSFKSMCYHTEFSFRIGQRTVAVLNPYNKHFYIFFIINSRHVKYDFRSYVDHINVEG